MARAASRLGEWVRGRVGGAVREWGYYGALLAEAVYWLLAGGRRRQPVRAAAVFEQMMEIGVAAVPIVFLLSFAIGVMLAIQGIHTLRTFGAESEVVVGITLAVSREFGPLITAVVVAGRTGSALAARIGSMQVSQEIDALVVMGINPVRYLVSPALLATLAVLPALSFMADVAAWLGAAIYTRIELGTGIVAFGARTLEVLATEDLMQGLAKSVVFALVIALVGVSNGFSVSGGAEGVGRATTRSVVYCISYIVLADMVFTWFLSQ